MAKRVAEATGGELIPIADLMGKESVEPGPGAMGIVFPVYFATNDCGIPLVIERFVKKLKIDSVDKYIFAIVTCGSMPGTTIENLARLIEAQGGRLSLGLAVKMGNRKLTQEKQERIREETEGRLEAVCGSINAGKHRLETRSRPVKLILTPLLVLLIRPVFALRYRRLSGSPRLPFRQLIPLADRGFQCNEKCDGCGVCSRVCPVKNIKIVGGRPEWQHRCENCYGCYGWCPKGAICGDMVSYNERYHNPYVKLSDMLRPDREV